MSVLAPQARRTPLVLAATLGAASVVMATTTCVTATIPVLAADLEASQTEVQWIADSYPVVLAALLLPAGALLDRFGRRAGLLVGLSLMIVTLIWSGLADSPGELIWSRAIAGLAGALIFPATLATITSVIAPEKRSLAVGLWAGSVMAGGGYGLVVGGATAEFTDWGTSFHIVAGIAAICLLLTLVAIPETRDPEHAHLDPLGGVLSCVGVAGLVIGIIEMPVHGVGDRLVWGALLIGATGLAAFVTWELRIERPLLEVRLFADRMFSAAALWIFVMYAVAYGWFFMAFQYYAFVLDWGPLQGTLGLMPFLIPLVVVTPIGPVITQRVGLKNLLLGSMAIFTIGMAAAAFLGEGRSFGWIALAFTCVGLGGVGQGPATQAIIDALPRAKQGVASAVNDVGRELGAAIGIAVIGSAFTAGYHHHLDGQTEPVPEVVRSAPAAGLEAAAQTPDPAATVELVRQGVVTGWEFGLLAASVALALTFVVIALRAPGSHRAAAAATPGRHRGHG